VIERLSALTLDTEMGVLAFCTSRQIQQLGQRINMRFTIHEDQTLHAIRGIFRIRHQYMRGWLLRLLFLHGLRPHEQIAMTFNVQIYRKFSMFAVTGKNIPPFLLYCWWSTPWPGTTNSSTMVYSLWDLPCKLPRGN